MLELYHWEPAGHSLRVLICLHEIGDGYRTHYVDALKFEQFSADFLKLNPSGQLPVLTSDGVAMAESVLLNEYLAESYPDAQLAPTDPVGWYNVQVWSKFIDYNLASSLGTLGCRKFLVPVLEAFDQAELKRKIASIPVPERRAAWERAAAGDYDAELVANAERKVKLVVERMEAALAEGEWLVGGKYSIADIDAFALINGLEAAAPHIVNDRNAPRVIDWASRIAARPAVREVLSSPGLKRRKDTVFLPGPEHSRWG